jgi:hypothetical protein
VSDENGFATTTLGPTYWGERLGARLTTLRLGRQRRTPIGQVRSGVVHVRGTARALGPTIRGPVSGRAVVLGRLLSCVEPVAIGRRNDGRTLRLADVTFGGDFTLEDETGRARVAVGPGVSFELLVLVRRAGAWNASSWAESLDAFARANVDASIPVDLAAAVHGEWAIEEGQTLSVIASVVGEDAFVDGRDYRSTRTSPVLGPRGAKPILFFE